MYFSTHFDKFRCLIVLFHKVISFYAWPCVMAVYSLTIKKENLIGLLISKTIT